MKDYKTNNYEELVKMLKEQGYNYHHSATARGYTPSGTYFYLHYDGKFGEGYKVECPNNTGMLDGRKSNRYYRIEYWTK